ncbi:MAG: cation:proton antiporter [Candidatus Thermoplasmatota archaeon]|jgi:Kef-type K+ transport system membrane component KefB|nr:cation:proton antiporter [Candidatus Thermoplasmatota archaeon]
MDIIIALLGILVFSLILGELFEKFNLPAVAGELISGVILGPAVLNWIQPNGVLTGFSEVSLFFIVLLIGVEVTVDLLRKNTSRGFNLSVTSFIIPVTLMFVVSFYVFHLGILSALALSISIGVPSISIISVLIKQYDLLETVDGQIILASVVLTDIIAFSIISVETDFIRIIYIVPAIVMFMVLFFILDRYITRNSNYVVRIFERLHARERGEKIIFSSVIISGLLVASIFEFLGVSYILGAFFAGMLISEVMVGKELQGILTRTLNRINEGFFIPIFFSIAGLLVIIPKESYLLLMLVMSSISIVVGGGLTYFRSGQLLKMVKRRTTAGILGGRGAVGIIIATIAVRESIINSDMYTIAVVATITISVIMTPFIQRQHRKSYEKKADSET